MMDLQLLRLTIYKPEGSPRGSIIVVDAVPSEKKKPGRKVETPAERLARLERDIVAARKAVGEAEREKLSVVGQAVLAEAMDNESFRDQLHALLKARVTGKGKAAIAGLFA